jgi:guanine deaminase
MTTIIRAHVAHTPRNPFVDDDALETFGDGAIAFADGRILACGSYADVRDQHPDGDTIDTRDAFLLPGFVDCHVHYPQIAVIGAMGLELLDWLKTRTLPEEARLADDDYAAQVAGTFVRALAANGTTTALVFGSHFPGAQDALFSAAEDSGLRIASGLVVSDRNLRPELEVTPEAAFETSRALIRRWHGRGLLRYVVTPRFSVSCSDGMLEACRALGEEADGLLFTSHLNENRSEIEFVGELFGWARDYLDTYERYGLVHDRSVFAHNVHPTDDELRRLAAARASIAHCPSSNAFLGSGVFAMRRHLRHGVRFALGSDVGAGTGLSLLKEGLMAYHVQMVWPDGHRLSPAHILYLATAAGAAALGLDDEVGDLSPGKSADFVLVRPPDGSTLQAVLDRSPNVRRGTGGTVHARARGIDRGGARGGPCGSGVDARNRPDSVGGSRVAELAGDHAPMLGQPRPQCVGIELPHARRRPRDADRSHGGGVVRENRRRDAHDARLVLLVVERVAALPRKSELAFELIAVGDGVRGERAQVCACQQRARHPRGLMGQHRLACPGSVGGHAAADLGEHANRLRARHLVDVHHRHTVKHDEVRRLVAGVADRLEMGQGDRAEPSRPRLDVAHQREQLVAQSIAAGPRVLDHPLPLDQGLDEPVGRGRLQPSATRELGQRDLVIRGGHELEQIERAGHRLHRS